MPHTLDQIEDPSWRGISRRRTSFFSTTPSFVNPPQSARYLGKCRARSQKCGGLTIFFERTSLPIQHHALGRIQRMVNSNPATDFPSRGSKCTNIDSLGGSRVTNSRSSICRYTGLGATSLLARWPSAFCQVPEPRRKLVHRAVVRAYMPELRACARKLQTSVKELQTSVKKLQMSVKKLQTSVKKLQTPVKKLQMSVKKLPSLRAGPSNVRAGPSNVHAGPSRLKKVCSW